MENKTPEVYYIEQGEPIAILDFKEGEYTRTSTPYVDPAWDIPYVCRLGPTAKRPELMEVICQEGKGVRTRWQMFSSEDVTIPPLEDRVIRTEAGFAFHPDLIGRWINYPLIKSWTPIPKSFMTCDHWKNPDQTARVKVQNMTKETITIRANSTIAILQFQPRTDDYEFIDLDPEITVCSIEPGARVTRITPHSAWTVHPMTEYKLLPNERKTIKTGVTFHIPEGYRGVWDTLPERMHDLIPSTFRYVKDPEVTVRNSTTRTISVYPWTPIAKVKLEVDRIYT